MKKKKKVCQRRDMCWRVDATRAPRNVCALRCRANMAHVTQSGPDSGPGFQVKHLKSFYVVPFSLGIGPRWRPAPRAEADEDWCRQERESDFFSDNQRCWIRYTTEMNERTGRVPWVFQFHLWWPTRPSLC